MRKLIIGAMMVLAGTAGAGAQENVVDGIYAQILGGVGLDVVEDGYYNDGEHDYTDYFRSGPAIAGTLGVVVLDGLSVEADVMFTGHQDSDTPDENISTLSAMANLKYTGAVTDTLSLYGAVGLGYIHASENDGEYEFGGAGFQLIAGGSFKLTDSIDLVGEYRFQNSFDGLDNENDSGEGYIEMPESAVMAGAKFSF